MFFYNENRKEKDRLTESSGTLVFYCKRVKEILRYEFLEKTTPKRPYMGHRRFATPKFCTGSNKSGILYITSSVSALTPSLEQLSRILLNKGIPLS